MQHPVEVATEPSRPEALRILVLDDELAIRRLYERMLTWLGFEFVLAADGRTAVEEFVHASSEGHPFDLLILDLTLPGGMGGVEVLDEVRGMDPGVRAIVSSGYSDSSVLANPADNGFAGVLSKPFTIGVLSRAIQQVRAQRNGGSSRHEAPPGVANDAEN